MDQQLICSSRKIRRKESMIVKDWGGVVVREEKERRRNRSVWVVTVGS